MILHDSFIALFCVLQIEIIRNFLKTMLNSGCEHIVTPKIFFMTHLLPENWLLIS